MNLESVINNLAQLVADPVIVTMRGTSEERPLIKWVNNAFCDTFGVAQEDALKMSLHDVLHWDYVDDFKARVEELAADGNASLSIDTLCLRRDQSSFWGSASFTRIENADDQVRLGILVVRDIDELKNREQAAELALIENEFLLTKFEAAQARLTGAIEAIPDPFAIFDRKEKLVTWNPAFVARTTSDPKQIKKGMRKIDVLRLAVDNGFVDDAVGAEEEWLENHMAAWRRGDVSEVVRIGGHDFKTILSEAPNGDRVVLRVDISEQLRQRQKLEDYAQKLEQANNEISHQALHDELTGLGNRRYLTLKLDNLIADRTANGGELVALHIDLDRFKQINDTMGHAAGDHVLSKVADILRDTFRQDDIVARVGGDEFIVVFKIGEDSSVPEKLSQRVIDEVSKPIPFEDKQCRLGASVGIARTPMIEADELLTSSDIALYKAKQAGRAMHAAFDHQDLENLRSAKQMTDDIVRAIEEDEFQPNYQVQIDPFKNRVVSLEVLARWHHPERGLIMPDEFCGIAEDMQLLGQIDEVIFQRALAECHEPFEQFDDPPMLAFNISMQRLMDAGLEQQLQKREYPFPIAFELVETEVFDQRNEAFHKRVIMLRTHGIGIEVDDFGSGRASIIGLRELGADRLKLDHRLIQPITESSSAKRLVLSMLDVAAALGIPVTAEGVETAEHASILTGLGCDRLQGFHFAHALPLNDVVALISAYEAGGALTGTNN